MGKKDKKKSEKKKGSGQEDVKKSNPKVLLDKLEMKDGELETNCFCEPYELTYKVPNKDKKYTAVSLVNTEKQKMIFKFKCNSSKNFTVRPVYGYVSAGHATAIMLTCKPLKLNMCSKNHKITVVVAPKTDDMPNNDAAKCWDLTEPYCPKKNAAIVVPIRYDLESGEMMGGFTDEERVRIDEDHRTKYEILGGAGEVRKLHDAAATVCIDQQLKQDKKEHEQAKKDLIADNKTKDEKKVVFLFVKEPKTTGQGGAVQGGMAADGAAAGAAVGGAAGGAPGGAAGGAAAAGPCDASHVIVNNKQYRKMFVPPNPWFEQFRTK